MSRDLRARDSTIKDIADKLSETAEAAEAAASAAYTMDEHRRIACAEIERLSKDSEKQQELFTQKVCQFASLGMILGKLPWTINPCLMLCVLLAKESLECSSHLIIIIFCS